MLCRLRSPSKRLRKLNRFEKQASVLGHCGSSKFRGPIVAPAGGLMSALRQRLVQFKSAALRRFAAMCESNSFAVHERRGKPAATFGYSRAWPELVPAP